MADFTKPLPIPTDTSRPFWDGLRAGEVHLQQCDACQQWVFYPRNRCDACLSDQLRWKKVSGAGTIYTFTVSRVPTAPHFADELPQLLAVVELAEGVRLTTTLTDVEPEDVKIGMPVEPVFDQVTAEVTLLRYRPASP